MSNRNFWIGYVICLDILIALDIFLYQDGHSYTIGWSVGILLGRYLFGKPA